MLASRSTNFTMSMQKVISCKLNNKMITILGGKKTSEYSGALAAILKGGVTCIAHNICSFLPLKRNPR
jgi:hypothetical protein